MTVVRVVPTFSAISVLERPSPASSTILARCANLRPFLAAARKTPTGQGSRNTRTRASNSDSDTAKVRTWAKDNGYPVSDRGRIHQTVEDAY
jgi:hypothetical protein